MNQWWQELERLIPTIPQWDRSTNKANRQNARDQEQKFREIKSQMLLLHFQRKCLNRNWASSTFGGTFFFGAGRIPLRSISSHQFARLYYVTFWFDLWEAHPLWKILLSHVQWASGLIETCSKLDDLLSNLVSVKTRSSFYLISVEKSLKTLQGAWFMSLLLVRT